MDYDSSVQCKNTENKIEEAVETTPMMAKLHNVILSQISALEMHSSDGEFLDHHLNTLSKEISSAEVDDEKVKQLKNEVKKTEQKLKFITERMELLTVTMEKSYELMQSISDWHKFKFNMNELEQITSSEIKDQSSVGACDYLAQINTTEQVENHDKIVKSNEKLCNDDTNEENIDNLSINDEVINKRMKEEKDSSVKPTQENSDIILEKYVKETNKTSSTIIAEINNEIAHGSEFINSDDHLLKSVDSNINSAIESTEPYEYETKCIKINQFNDHDQCSIPDKISQSPKIINLKDEIDDSEFDVDSITENSEESILDTNKDQIRNDLITSSTQTDDKITCDKITETENGSVVTEFSVAQATAATDAAGDINRPTRRNDSRQDLVASIINTYELM